MERGNDASNAELEVNDPPAPTSSPSAHLLSQRLAPGV